MSTAERSRHFWRGCLRLNWSIPIAMKGRMYRTLLCVLVSAALAAADPATPVPALPATCAQLVAELVPAGAARPAAIRALHAFVRDRISEIPTKYG